MFKYDVGVSANLRVQSGFGYSRLISATLPRAGTLQFFSENNENNRSEAVPILDLRADKAFRIGRYRFTGMLDVYNLTNFTLVNGASYNKIIGTLDPRVLQLGVRFDF